MFFLAQFPAASQSNLAELVVLSAVVVFFIDRLVSIFTNLRRDKTDVMPRAQLQKELDRLELKIDGVARERRESSDKIFKRIDAFEHSMSLSLNDFSRAMGRLEGSTNVANAIKAALETKSDA